MIIGNDITSQEKDLFTEILYNKEAILIWDFTKMRKVKKEVASAQKILLFSIKLGKSPAFRFPRLYLLQL